MEEQDYAPAITLRTNDNLNWDHTCLNNTHPLHERFAAADLVGQRGQKDRHLLTAADRGLQADSLEQGEIHQPAAGLLLGDGVAVDHAEPW